MAAHKKVAVAVQADAAGTNEINKPLYFISLPAL